jgi:5'-3' exonuclease
LDAYLVDGTYELFRHFFVLPSTTNAEGEEVAATRGVLESIVGMLESGVTHVGVATDHVIESFRNDLWPGYKTSAGVDQQLLSQFPVLEESLQSMGVTVWPMVELEADDALAGAAASLVEFRKVGKVYICTPDKDLAQCVRDDRVVQMDRRAQVTRNEEGVLEKFGVRPASIPDFLALVGDSADGYPGIEGWGERSAGKMLNVYKHLEAIPKDSSKWKVQLRGPDRLSDTLQRDFKLALLFRDLATLRTKEPSLKSPNDILWTGPTASFDATWKRLNSPKLRDRVNKLVESRRIRRSKRC